jgi:transcription elongation factor S-II
MATSASASTSASIKEVNEKRTFVQKQFEKLGLAELEAKDLEIGIYNSAIELAGRHRVPLTWNNSTFIEIYLAKCRSIYANLNKEAYIGNMHLYERFNEKEFKPHEIAFMTSDRLFPHAWNDIITKEMLRNKSAYENTQVSMTDQMRCGKCKKNKVSYYELQTRSGDEASTIFYTCLSCGFRWKL